MVVVAFTEHRYELGAALARLCVQAQRVERDSAPMVAPAPVPYADAAGRPNYPAPVPAEVYTTTITPASLDPDECFNSYGSKVPWGDPSCARIEHGDPHKPAPEAAPAPAENDVTALTPVVPSTRCIAMVGGPGRERECHQVLIWREGDAATLAGWEHYDGFTGHAPRPLLRDGMPR